MRPGSPMKRGVLLATAAASLVTAAASLAMADVLAPAAVSLAGDAPPAADALIAALPAVARPELSAVSAAGRLAWRVPLEGRAVGAVTLGDRVVVALPDGLEALDAASGSLLWRLPLEGRPTAPVAHGGLVVVGTSAGRLVAVDPATGAPRWNVDAGGPVAAPPTPARDLIVVGTKQREVLGVTVADGLVRWSVILGGRVTAPTAVLPGVVYVAAWDGRLTALDPETGAVRWSARLGGPVEVALAATRGAGGRDAVVALREDGTLVAVVASAPAETARSGTAPFAPRVAWTHRLDADDPAPAAADGRLFLGGRDLTALDAASGRVLWRLSDTLTRTFNREVVRRLVDRERGLSPEEVRTARAASPYELRGAVDRSPVVAGGLVLTTTDEGFLYAVDPATGELRWRIAEGD